MRRSDDRARSHQGELLRPLEAKSGFERESALHRQAAQLLSSPDSLSVIRSQARETLSDQLPKLLLTGAEGSGPRQLTEADCHAASRNKERLNQSDAEQVAQIVSTSPTSESIVALADRDLSRAVDMCQKRADIRSVAEHNDDLPQSFHRLLKLAQTGFEG